MKKLVCAIIGLGLMIFGGKVWADPPQATASTAFLWTGSTERKGVKVENSTTYRIAIHVPVTLIDVALSTKFDSDYVPGGLAILQ